MLERIAVPDEVRRWRETCPSGTGTRPASPVRSSSRRFAIAARCSERAARPAPTRTSPRACSASGASPSSPADAEVGPGGTLVSFTIMFRDVEGEPLEEPVTIGLVRLDGADGVLLHRVLDPGDEPLEIGERVEVVLASERVGSILDIQGFRPTE